MPRITAVSGAGVTAEDPWSAVDSIFDHRPAANAALKGLVGAIAAEGTLSPRLLELVRLRIGFHNQCRTCMAVRYQPDLVSEDLVCTLEKPQEAADLTADERAALGYADLFATNHFAIGDADYDELRTHFDEGQIVELGMFCAYCVGFGRLMASWSVVEQLPASFQTGDSVITPWGHERVAVPSRSDWG
jgi:alkylhydroperoxidase family enzyme